MNIKKQLQNFHRYYKEGGMFSVLHRLSVNAYIPHWIIYVYGSFILELTSLNSKLIRRDMSMFEFTEVDENALDELCACKDEDAPEDPRELFSQYFRDGRKCYVIKANNKIVVYMWAFKDTYKLDFQSGDRNSIIRLSDDIVFLGNGHITKEYRLKGLFPFAIDYIVRQYPESLRIFTSVDYYNSNSINSHLRLGYKKIAFETCLSLFNINSYWFKKNNGSWSFLGFRAPTLDLPFKN